MSLCCRLTLMLMQMLICSSLRGDLLLLKGSSEPVYGRLVERTETTVTFDQRIGGGTERKSYSRDAVDLLVINYDPDRLGQLRVGRLQDYLDYAEELVPQRRDPEARELAIRLCAVVGHWAGVRGQEGLQASALRNLQVLARDDAERARFQQLAFLCGLALPEVEVDGARGTLRREELRALVRALRTGDRQEAQAALSSGDLQRAWQPWSDILSWTDLRQIAAANRPTTLQLERLLRVELGLLRADARMDAPRPRLSWSAEATDRDSDEAWLPDFRRATEFDPRQAEYRGGRWVEPSLPSGGR